MFALALLLPLPEVPVIPAAPLSMEMQWKAVEACPVIRTVQGHGSGVVIGKKENDVYVLTAAHVVPFDGAGAEFYTKESWPKTAWRANDSRVVQRWEGDVDLALVRCSIGKNVPGVLSLAAPGQRPKVFPAAALSVGAEKGTFPTFEVDTILAKKLVRSQKDPSDVVFFWEMSLPSRRGRSGGPLLDLNGRVIGICAATQGGRGYFVHLDEILAGLKKKGGEYSWLVPSGHE